MENTNVFFQKKGMSFVRYFGKDYFYVGVFDRTTKDESEVKIDMDDAQQLHAWLTNQLGLGWISVENKLPERTPVAYDKTILIDNQEYDGFYSYDFKSWSFFNPIDRCYYNCKPTHWREKFPLPEVDE